MCVYFPVYNLINTVALLNVLTSIFVDVVTSQATQTRAEESEREQDAKAAEEEAEAERVAKAEREARAAQANLPVKSLLFVQRLKMLVERAHEDDRNIPLRLRKLEAHMATMVELMQKMQKEQMLARVAREQGIPSQSSSHPKQDEHAESSPGSDVEHV